MADLLYHNLPNILVFLFMYFSGSCVGRGEGVQGGEKQVDAFSVWGEGAVSSLLLMSPVEHSCPFSHPRTHFPLRGSGNAAVTDQTSKFGLKPRPGWTCPNLSEQSLPSGSFCSAQPVHAGCFQNRRWCGGDIYENSVWSQGSPGKCSSPQYSTASNMSLISNIRGMLWPICLTSDYFCRKPLSSLSEKCEPGAGTLVNLESYALIV